MRVLLTKVKPFVRSLPKNFLSKASKNTRTALPIVAAPIVLYDIYNDNLKKLLNEMKEAGVDIPKYFSVSPLSNSGLDETSKSRFRNNIYKAAQNNEIDETTKNRLLSKVTFTGKPDDESITTIADTEVPENSTGFFASLKSKFLDIKDNIKAKVGTVTGNSSANEMINTTKVSIHDPNFVNVDIDNVDVSLPSYLQKIADTDDIDLLDSGAEDLIAELNDNIMTGDDVSGIFHDIVEKFM